MKPDLVQIGVEHLSDESLDLLLDEAERALLDVETRADEPWNRVVSDDDDESVSELRLAIAELADAYPGIHHDLESIGDRLRNLGPIAASELLEVYPQVAQLVRLSLEVFFRQYLTVRAYENDGNRAESFGEVERTPAEIYEAYGELLSVLRQRVS